MVAVRTQVQVHMYVCMYVHRKKRGESVCVRVNIVRMNKIEIHTQKTSCMYLSMYGEEAHGKKEKKQQQQQRRRVVD